jgi:pimeloyl-ACP methyl ester carboxylesterase
MTSYVTSRDGTRLAFDRIGTGPPLVLVGGILCDRGTTRALADRLAEEFTVVNYDRRGRGESGNTLPYAVDREIEDLGALIDGLGGRASVYGHSSGAGLALNAAASGLPIQRLVLHEPPYGADDPESVAGARRLARTVLTAVAEDRRADALRAFLTEAGMPEEMAEESARDPGMLAVAATMPHDLEVMGEVRDGGVVPEDVVRSVDVPTLVLAGGASPGFFRDTAVRVAELLPEAEHVVLDGQDHAAPPDAVAPVVSAFLLDT